MNTGDAGTLQIIPYHSPAGSTTCYFISQRDRSGTILVDPVRVDSGFYRIILEKNLHVRWVLVTHPEEYMRYGLRTLSRIFRFEIISGVRDLFGMHSRELVQDEVNNLVLEEIPVQAIPFLPHSHRSYVYRIGDALFSGAIFHAGTLGDTPSTYNEELLIATVEDHLFTLPRAEREIILLPSVGPPSTLQAERHLSPFYRHREFRRTVEVPRF